MTYDSDTLCILVFDFLKKKKKIVILCCFRTFIGVRREIIIVMFLNSEEVTHLKVMYHLIGIGGYCKNTSVMLGIFEEYACSWQHVLYYTVFSKQFSCHLLPFLQLHFLCPEYSKAFFASFLIAMYHCFICLEKYLPFVINLLLRTLLWLVFELESSCRFH